MASTSKTNIIHRYQCDKVISSINQNKRGWGVAWAVQWRGWVLKISVTFMKWAGKAGTEVSFREG